MQIDTIRSAGLLFGYTLSIPLHRSSIDPLRDPNTGALARPLRTDVLWVPEHVDADDVRLTFGRAPVRVVTVPRDLLERFLTTRSDASIVTFARKFGPLRIDATKIHEFLKKADRGGMERLADEIDERLEVWRATRRQFSGLLALAAELRERDRPSKAVLLELDALGVDFVYSEPRGNWNELSAGNQRMAAAVDLVDHLRFLTIATQLRPGIAVANLGQKNARFEFVFQDVGGHYLGSYLTLFGALVAQLLSAVTGSGFATCHACRETYVPNRKPRQGERTYCQRCGRAAAVRDAKVRFRNNRRQEKEKRNVQTRQT
jgi:hypothetical protein